jgi:hypothetical protein
LCQPGESAQSADVLASGNTSTQDPLALLPRDDARDVFRRYLEIRKAEREYVVAPARPVAQTA